MDVWSVRVSIFLPMHPRRPSFNPLLSVSTPLAADQVLVYGTNRPHNIAILVPNWEKLQAFGVQHGAGAISANSTKARVVCVWVWMCSSILHPSIPCDGTGGFLTHRSFSVGN